MSLFDKFLDWVGLARLRKQGQGARGIVRAWLAHWPDGFANALRAPVTYRR